MLGLGGSEAAFKVVGGGFGGRDASGSRWMVTIQLLSPLLPCPTLPSLPLPSYPLLLLPLSSVSIPLLLLLLSSYSFFPHVLLIFSKCRIPIYEMVTRIFPFKLHHIYICTDVCIHVFLLYTSVTGEEHMYGSVLSQLSAPKSILILRWTVGVPVSGYCFNLIQSFALTLSKN